WRVRVASSDGAKRGGFWENQGRMRWFGPGARHLSAQVAGAGVRRRRWTWCREMEVEDAGRGNFVNKTKFKNQFCNFNFSPSSWPQMKKFLIPFLLGFSRSTTFVLCTFSFVQWFESYYKTMR